MEKRFFFFGVRLSSILGLCVLFLPFESHGAPPRGGTCSPLPAGMWGCYVQLKSDEVLPSISETCDRALSAALHFCARNAQCISNFPLDACPGSQSVAAPSSSRSASVGDVLHVACQGSDRPEDHERTLQALKQVLGVKAVQWEAKNRYNEIVNASELSGIESHLGQVTQRLLLDGQQNDSSAFLTDVRDYLLELGKPFVEGKSGIVLPRPPTNKGYQDNLVFARSKDGPVMLNARRFASTPSVAGERPSLIQKLVVFTERNFATGEEVLKIKYEKDRIPKITDLDGLASDWEEAKCARQAEQVNDGLQPQSPVNWVNNIPVIGVSDSQMGREGSVEIKDIPENIPVVDRMRMIRQQYQEKMGSGAAIQAR